MSYPGLAESGKFAYTNARESIVFANATGDVSGPISDLRITNFMGYNIIGVNPPVSGQVFGYDSFLNAFTLINVSGQIGPTGPAGSTGPQGPEGPIVGWSGVLARNNYSGPYSIIVEQRSYYGGIQELGSGIPILWSNILSSSGSPQLGLVASGSGILRVTDGWAGIGHIFYSPSAPTDWSAPAPTNITVALDQLAKATGILAGGTGNLPSTPGTSSSNIAMNLIWMGW